MPAAQVEFDYGDKALDRVIDIRHLEHKFGMCHEAIRDWLAGWKVIYNFPRVETYFVIRSNIDRGSRIKVGRVTLLRSAPGRSCDMIWERTMCPVREER
jgi:hypothetical protein